MYLNQKFKRDSWPAC